MSLHRSILILLAIFTVGLLWSQVNPPSNLEFTLENGNDIQLTWQAPPMGEWVDWCGEYTNSIGTGAALNFEVAARFAVADLAAYAGGVLTMVSFVPAETATYSVKVYAGGSQTGTTATPGTVQRTQAVPTYTLDEWNTVTLNSPLTININQELWIAMAINTQTGYPAGCDDGPSIPWKGDLIKNGGTWSRLALLAPTLNYNFTIRGFVELPGRPGELVEINLTPEEFAPIQGTLGSIAHTPVPFPANDATRALLGYNIFRDGVQLNTEIVTNSFYIDEDLNTGLYSYYVVAVWDEGTSEPSNTIQGVVPVADGNNNTPQTATTLILNTEGIPYMIESIGDDDWYKFQLPVGADLFTFSELVGGSELDTEFHLYGPANENGSNVVPATFIATDDNTHGQNQPQILYPVTQAGWYFLRVAFNGDNPTRASIGFYTLFVRALGATTNFPPSSLTATVTDYVNVDLNWNLPAGQSNLMHYDSGENADGIGLQTASVWSTAIRFTSYDLVSFHNKYLTQVSFFPQGAGDFTLKVWQGGSWTGTSGNSGTLLVTQGVPNATIGEWNTVTLSNPVHIQATSELWIGFEIADPGASFPAGVDAGPAVNHKGNLIQTGTVWNSLFDANAELNYNWNIQGITADTPGLLAVARPLVHQSVSYGNGASVYSNPVKHPRSSQYFAPYLRNLTGYKVYRNGTMIHQIDNPTAITYADESLAPGNYQYYLTSIYTGNVESNPSNTANATIGELVLNPPLNLHGTINSPNVILIWDRPATGMRPLDITAYKVYRNGDYIATQTNPNVRFYNVQNNPAGNHIFTVTAVYNTDFESGPSNEFAATGNDDNNVVPMETSLLGASPNPFKPDTRITFSVKDRQVVKIEVYNVLGQKVSTLVNSEKNAGTHSVTWNGRDAEGKQLTSGLYFYKMTSGKFSSTKKMVLLR